MTAPSRIAELASIIQSSTTKVDEYLKAHGILSPSFDLDAPAKLSLPADIADAREAILAATDELNVLMLGPVRYLVEYNYNSLISLQAIEKYNIASSVPVGGRATFEEIAKASNLNVNDTRKILRQAIAHYVFKEPEKGVIEHTAISKQIAENPLMRDWIFFMTTEGWRSAPRVVDAMTKWPESQELEHTGWSLANETPLPLVQEIMKFPERLARMPGAMQMTEQSDGLEVDHFIKNFNWAGAQTFVDVGGAHGSAAIEVARRFPHIKCIVQDLPFVLATGKVPDDVQSNVKFMPHDFHTPQPVKGAEVYYLRFIFHNWSDKFSINILQNLIPALKKGARVVANDFLLPEPGTLAPYRERGLRNFDLSMKQLMNAKEREMDEWTALVAAADPGFKLASVKVPEGSKMAVIEIVWEGENHS